VGWSNRFYTIAVEGAPTFETEEALPDANVDQAYSLQIAVQGVPAPTFSLVDGSLPPGYGLSASGLISGTTSADGFYGFTVRAANVHGARTRAFTLTVADVPAISSPSPLPSGSLGVPYSEQIVASGNPVFTVVFGSLPGGLSLGASGVVTGTPSAVGTFFFTVRASNAYGFDERSYELSVTDLLPPTFTSIRPTNGNARLEWNNPNASPVEVWRTTNITWMVPVPWTNLGVQVSPWTNVSPPRPSYYQLRVVQ
jgi:hypothetical protein